MQKNTLQNIFTLLEKEVGQIVATVEIYDSLFIREERVWPILDNSAKNVWHCIQTIMAHQIILDITKLLDPCKSAPKELNLENQKQNLTLQWLPELVSGKQQELRSLIDIANSKELKDMRNKAIGHNDLNWIKDPSSWPDVENKHLLDTVKNIEEVLNIVPDVHRNGYDLIKDLVSKETQLLIGALDIGLKYVEASKQEND